MSDAQMGEQVVEQTTQVAPTEQIEQEVATPVQEDQQPETETGNNEVIEDAAPKDNKAWAAMRVENKKLKEALEETGVDAEYLEQLKAVTRGQDVRIPLPQQITEDTDYGTAIQGINEARQLSYQTRQELAQLRAERREAEDREAENAFPSLRTDKVFQSIVAEKRLAAEIMGRRRPTIEIAREVDAILNRRAQQIQAQASEEAGAREAAKHVATREPQTTTTQGVSSYHNEDARNRVRKGDRAAQVEMAKGLIADLDF